MQPRVNYDHLSATQVKELRDEEIETRKNIADYVHSVLLPFMRPISKNNPLITSAEIIIRALDFAITFEDKGCKENIVSRYPEITIPIIIEKQDTICIENIICKHPETIIPIIIKRKDICLNFLYDNDSKSNAAIAVQAYIAEQNKLPTLQRQHSRKRINSKSRRDSGLFSSPRINKNAELPENFEKMSVVEKVLFLLVKKSFEFFKKHATDIFIDLGNSDRESLNQFAKIVLEVETLTTTEKKSYFKFVAYFIDNHNANQQFLDSETLETIADSIIVLANESKDSMIEKLCSDSDATQTNSFYDFVLKRAYHTHGNTLKNIESALSYLLAWRAQDELNEVKIQSPKFS